MADSASLDSPIRTTGSLSNRLKGCEEEPAEAVAGLWDDEVVWLRSKKRRRESVDLVEVPVGYERVAATLLTAQCEAAGIPARLLTMDDNGQEPGILALTEHRLLVRRVDRERVVSLAKQYL